MYLFRVLLSSWRINSYKLCSQAPAHETKTSLHTYVSVFLTFKKLLQVTSLYNRDLATFDVVAVLSACVYT